MGQLSVSTEDRPWGRKQGKRELRGVLRNHSHIKTLSYLPRREACPCDGHFLRLILKEYRLQSLRRIDRQQAGGKGTALTVLK